MPRPGSLGEPQRIQPTPRGVKGDPMFTDDARGGMAENSDVSQNSELDDLRIRAEALRRYLDFFGQANRDNNSAWQHLQLEDPSEAGRFRGITKGFQALQASDPKYQTMSHMDLVAKSLAAAERRIAKMEQRQQAPAEERPQQAEVGDTSRRDAEARIAQLRGNVADVQALVDFFKAGGDWTAVDRNDPVLGHKYRATYESLKAQSQQHKDGIYQGMSLAQVAADIIERNTRIADGLEAQLPPKPQELPVVRYEARQEVQRPREELSIATLNLATEGLQQWQILRINPRERMYIIGRVSDRRSPGDIIADVMSERDYRGMPAGYMISWADFERAAKSTQTGKGGRLRAGGE